jgi:hypothetical protein
MIQSHYKPCVPLISFNERHARPILFASFQSDQSCQECQHASPNLRGIVRVVFDGFEICIGFSEINYAIILYGLVLDKEITWWR